MEPMHKDFPLIPQRSYDAIVRNGWLSEVLLALIVDPLEAEEVAAKLYRNLHYRLLFKDYLSMMLFRDHPSMSENAADMPIGVDDFVRQGANATDAWRQVVAQWVRLQKDARPALRSLVVYNRWLGAWCSSHVAREVLDIVAGNKDRLLKQINVAEDWSCGKLTTAQVREISASMGKYAVYDFAADAAETSLRVITIYVADNAARAAEELADTVANAHAEASDTSEERWTTVCSAELVRLREVVAEACMTFPV